MNNKQRVELTVALQQLWDGIYDFEGCVDRALVAASAAAQTDLVALLHEMKQSADDMSVLTTRYTEDLKDG